MTFSPNSDVYLLKNVPIDPDYQHTLFFNTEAAQAQTMSGYAKYKLTKQSYQREGLGVFRADYTADQLYDVNYIMFRNTSYGSKWFYGFVTELEYINEGMTRVHYEIDVIQTWFFEATLGRCFVEREHAATDGLFNNTVPESVDLGNEYVTNPTSTDSYQSGYNIVFMATKTKNNTTPTPKIINGVFSGIETYKTDSFDAAVARLKMYEDRYDDIICMYQLPSWIAMGTDEEGNPAATTALKNVKQNLTSIDGYIPRNKKLFCYPYNFILVDNGNGQQGEVKWELWDSGSEGHFEIISCSIPTPVSICIPVNYRGLAQDFESGVQLADFVQCPWSGDTFKAWWAQTKSSTTLTAVSGAISGALQMAGNAVKGDVIGAVQGGVNTATAILQPIAKRQDMKNAPNQAKGMTNTSAINCALGRVGFQFLTLSVRAEVAKIIDDYFDLYGYQTNRIKVPNRNVRPHWTYTKTVGCRISGSLPMSDVKRIQQIYDNGITFWKNPTEVGDYSLDNRV